MTKQFGIEMSGTSHIDAIVNVILVHFGEIALSLSGFTLSFTVEAEAKTLSAAIEDFRKIYGVNFVSVK